MRAPHRWYLGAGGVLALLYLLVPPFRGSPELFDLLSASSAVAILVGVRIHRPSAVWPWLLFAFGQALFFLGDVYTYLYPRLIGHEVPFPSLGDGLYLAMYPVLMVGVLLIVRLRSPQGDRGGVLDALIVAVGIGLLSWVFLMEPYVTDATLPALAKVVSVAYPLGDVLLLAAVLRLVLDGGRRQGSFYLLVSAVATLFVTDAAYGYALLDGTFHHQLIYDAGWLGYYLLWGSVALHPSMRRLVEASPDRERRLSRRRLAVLTTASVLAPSVELVRQARSGSLELLVILSSSIVLFLLVVVRVAGLVRQFERAVARERVLREASAALVSATRAAEIESVAQAAAVSLVGLAGSIELRLEEGDHPVAEQAAGARIVVFPIGEPGRQRGWIRVESAIALSPLTLQALRTLADGAALALRSADASEARFASLVRNASDLTTVVDAAGLIGYQSPSIQRVLGHRAEAVQGTPFRDLLPPGEWERVTALLERRGDRDEPSQSFDCELLHADGHRVRFEMLVTDLLADAHVQGIVLNGRDISERSAFQAELTHQAFHDAVTGLPNRARFSELVERALGVAGSRVAVIFLDLDDFKTVNDSLGHLAGDVVLREVAQRLLDVTRPAATVARFGGDEFAVLLDDVEGVRVAQQIAERVIEALARPVPVEGQEIYVHASLGIALGEDRSSADALVRNADAAMYICKRAGEGGYRVFEQAMHVRALERLELRADLQRALPLGQLELHYQPIVDLRSGAISGFEALCRWDHPTRGNVPPDQFIPLAEESGLIIELGRWVLEEGCREAVAVQAATGTSGLRLGVNLSVKQLQHPEIVADVQRALATSGLDPDTLVLEITESVMIADAALAIVRLAELRALGCRIAMDDFGTGYSSLSHLGRLPVDILKMDQSFLNGPDDLAPGGLAAAIISLGSTLGLEVVAEGVERRSQLETLRELGCGRGQGYLFARPMSAVDARVWLAEMVARGGFDVSAEPGRPFDALELEAA